jgi:hypothetical protein
MAALHFPGMNRLLDYQLRTYESRGKPKETPAYTVALASLLLVWVVLGVMTAILKWSVLVPGHLGLGALLQALSNLLPADLPMFTTNHG